MNFSPVLPEPLAVDEEILYRFARIHAFAKLAIVAFAAALLLLAAVVTGHVNALLGSGGVTATAVIGFLSARRAAVLLRAGDGSAVRSIAPTSLRDIGSAGPCEGPTRVPPLARVMR